MRGTPIPNLIQAKMSAREVARLSGKYGDLCVRFIPISRLSGDGNIHVDVNGLQLASP